MADFPFPESETGSVRFDGPTLFVRGTRSRYVSDDTVPAIRLFFPNYRLADVEAGHWLISEKPEDFRQGLLSCPLLPTYALTNCAYLRSGRQVFTGDLDHGRP